MKEYRIKKGWAIFIYVIAIFFISTSLFALARIYTLDDLPLSWLIVLTLILIVWIAFWVLGIIDVHKGKITLTKDTLALSSVFLNRSIKLDEIKGYKVIKGRTFVLPRDKANKRIPLSEFVKDFQQLLEWLYANYPDLEQVLEEEENEEILQNKRYGDTKAEREGFLRRAKLTANILNWGGGLVCLWAIFYPSPYLYAILGCVALPLVALIVVTFFNGLVRIDEAKSNAYPNVIVPFLLASMALMLRALLDYNLFDYSDIIYPTLGLTTLMMVLIILLSGQYDFSSPDQYLMVLVLAALGSAYSYGAIVTLNGSLDDPVAEHYTAVVIKKKTGGRNANTYNVKLSAWGPQDEEKRVSIREDQYNRISEGDTVDVYLYKGKFNIPWIAVIER